MKRCYVTSLLLFGLLFGWENICSAAPPYSGTIFLDPDIITPSDRTTYEGLSDAGQGVRQMFDRRSNSWNNNNAFLFDATFDDGFTVEVQVNPEFGTVAAARDEAERYAEAIGRLPTALRTDLETVWIHLGDEAFGGGNNNLLIHTGRGENYIASGILEETLVHEATHTSLDSHHAAASGWLTAQGLDGEFISTYARDNPNREDVAETFLLYLAVTHRGDRISQSLSNTVRQTVPNRIAYLDAQSLDMYPIVVPNNEPPEPSLYVSSLNSHELFSHDPVTGQRRGAGAFVTASNAGLDRPHGILDTPEGILVASFGSGEVKRYDRTSGAFIDNFVPSSAGLSLPVYIAFGPADGHLYVSSQGNDRILRFDRVTGAAVDGAPFIVGGQLDGPSGFDWSPDGSILYVAGRYSANVLAYDAVTGDPLEAGHVFIDGLSSGDTFGLAVHRSTGDLFVATGSQVRRFSESGIAGGTVNVPGLEIGLEKGLDGESIYVASNNNLYRLAVDGHGVTGPLLSGSAISILNFFHFSASLDHRLGAVSIARGELEPGGQHVDIEFALSKRAFDISAVLEVSGDMVSWIDAARFQPTGTGITRTDLGVTTSVSMEDQDEVTVIRERTVEPASGGDVRFYRVRVD